MSFFCLLTLQYKVHYTCIANALLVHIPQDPHLINDAAAPVAGILLTLALPLQQPPPEGVAQAPEESTYPKCGL